MGYTTKFNGVFKFTAPLSAETVLLLMDLTEDSDDTRFEGNPGGYCQWVLTKQRDGLEWDGNEKFYDYVEWLQFIQDRILKPNGVELTGTVSYSGEDTTDNEMLVLEDGIVKQVANEAVGKSLTELQEFKEFALKWDADEEGELLRAWSEHKGMTF